MHSQRWLKMCIESWQRFKLQKNNFHVLAEYYKDKSKQSQTLIQTRHERKIFTINFEIV